MDFFTIPRMFDFCGVNLSGVNLSGVDLSGVNLSGADLRGVNLRGANLICANLSGVNLSGANLICANLSGANLREANLGEVNFRRANLSGANLGVADLSGVIGLPTSPHVFLEHNNDGVIAYKAFGNTAYAPRREWELRAGAVLCEPGCNPDRFSDCGSGVNVASTMEWVVSNYPNALSYWKVLIEWEDLPNVVVPYNSCGKYRCTRITLLEKVEVK